MVALSEIGDGLPLPNMFLPDFLGQFLWPSLVLPLFAASQTLVVLNAPSSSALFGWVVANGALFLHELLVFCCFIQTG